MDVLSDILSTVRLESTVFASLRMASPWGIRAAARDHFAFHVLTRGHCVLEVQGSDPVHVEAGEVVILGPGNAHSLRDGPNSPTRDLEEMLATGAFRQQPLLNDGAASLICGCFRFEAPGDTVLATALPSVIRAGDGSGEGGPWLAQTLRLLGYEAQSDRPGKATVVNRLCDAIFVYVLRSRLSSTTSTKPGWLRGLREPAIAEALGLIHGQPATAWTLAELSAAVGLSRSAFASRFLETVGSTPIRYLTRWRLEKAAVGLRDGGTTEQVTSGAGYDSVAAFSKAFKRHHGISPGAYRRLGIDQKPGQATGKPLNRTQNGPDPASSTIERWGRNWDDFRTALLNSNVVL